MRGADGLLWNGLLVLMAGAALTAGCAGDPNAPTSRYLVVSDGAPEAAQPSARAVLRVKRPDLAPYLRGEGIVLQTSSNTIREARNHLWAEDLASQLGRDLRHRLASELAGRRVIGPGERAPAKGDDSVVLSVTVDAFQGHFEGYAVVAGDWRLADADGEQLASGRFRETRPLSADGYNALVESLQAAWRGAVERVINDIRPHSHPGAATSADSG